jgi:hypothetical protein
MPTSTLGRKGRAMRALALVLFFGTLATGCGGSAGDATGDAKASPSPSRAPVTTPPPPAGYTRVVAGGLSLAYPPGWVKVPPPQGWVLAMELRTEDAAVARLGVITAVPQSGDADVVANTAFAGVQLNAAVERREPNKAVQVPGALAAIRVDYTYRDRSTGNEAQAADLSVVVGDRKAATVRITGVRGRLSPAMIDEILRTVIAPSP